MKRKHHAPVAKQEYVSLCSILASKEHAVCWKGGKVRKAKM